MIIAYILGLIVLSVVLFYIFSHLYYKIKCYILLERTGIYDALNNFVNTDAFLAETNYLGGNLNMEMIYPLASNYDNFFNPTRMETLLLLMKKDGLMNNFFVAIRKIENQWEIIEYSNLSEKFGQEQS